MAVKKMILSKKEIHDIVENACPEPLVGHGRRPIIGDHVGNALQLVGWGHARLAADHLLFPELDGSLIDVVSGILRRLNLDFRRNALNGKENAEERTAKSLARYYCYEFILEMSLNFLGLESSELDDTDRSACVFHVLNVLTSFEEIEREEYGKAAIAGEAVERILSGMELVQGGASMVAKSAGRIRKRMLASESLTCEFLEAADVEIKTNVYYEMASSGACKFGNDYALGLRWLRHLGFEQVSTNPVLAALAYKDDPSLKKDFARDVKKHPRYAQWSASPEKNGDDIALFATLTALWDNLHVYRPVFHNLKDTTGGGVVSFQLNPNIAHRAAESIADAFDALEQAQADLKVYDSYLLAGYEGYEDQGRPNVVIKIAASHPAAREIAREINSYGLGSNITVIYTVAQQITMVLEEMAGMASALRKGIVPTQLYVTNMGGRFESHLREVVLEGLFDKLKKKIGTKNALSKVEALAKANGSLEAVKAAGSYADKVVATTRYKAQSVIDANVIRALKDAATKKELELWESDIAKSGTLVARRAWGMFFSEKNLEKWIAYLSDTFGISLDDAFLVMSRINYLPASKRKPLDTFWTLTAHNMVHTEFGNHQENVLTISRGKDFELTDYVESIRDDFDPGVVERLNAIPDFPVGYEINAELKKLLDEVGVRGDFGHRGHKPGQWSKFGSVMKTSGEFKDAYDNFKAYVLGIMPEA